MHKISEHRVEDLFFETKTNELNNNSSSTIEDSSYFKVESLLDEYSQGEEEEDEIMVLNSDSGDVFNDS